MNKTLFCPSRHPASAESFYYADGTRRVTVNIYSSAGTLCEIPLAEIPALAKALTAILAEYDRFVPASADIPGQDFCMWAISELGRQISRPIDREELYGRYTHSHTAPAEPIRFLAYLRYWALSSGLLLRTYKQGGKEWITLEEPAGCEK